MKVSNVTTLDEDPLSIKVRKECTMTCLCLNRPVIHIEYCEDGQDMFIGKIEDEYDFCNFNFNILNESGDKRFRIYASCCQCGI